MYGYIYKTTILDNGKMYIGQKKSTVFLGESYIGSGAYLRRSIKKHGYKNFKVELIEWCKDKEELNNREEYWIAFYNAVESDQYYNQAKGGVCGCGRPKGFHQTERQKRILSELQRDGKGWLNGRHPTQETRDKMSKAHSGSNHPMYGKHHTRESKDKMREAKLRNLPKICASGKANPMTGRIWITNGIQCKAINPTDLPIYEEQGYHKGKSLDRKWINKDGEGKTVKSGEVNKYLALGWKLGMPKKNVSDL